ncbi:MAG: S46 family peptidase, partial [Bacteroidales bacterium]|nr:S46 family peptidase [Bacteroidales bacterium]
GEPLPADPLPADGSRFARLATHLYGTSALADRQKTMDLLAKDSASALELLREDAAFRLVNPYVEKNRTHIQPRIVEINRELNLLYRTWMQAIMEFDSDRIFYPDANSTLRVTYGTVQGYSPADAVMYMPVSTIEGIMQKDDPEIFDYDIPQSLRDLYAARDFGRWETDGTVPVCFIATNHTSGGNSGSPVLNADGHLLGLNFDRVWEGTMSDIEFDPSVCRNISVDIRYVLFVMDKIGNAKYLLEELDIIE